MVPVHEGGFTGTKVPVHEGGFTFPCMKEGLREPWFPCLVPVLGSRLAHF